MTKLEILSMRVMAVACLQAALMRHLGAKGLLSKPEAEMLLKNAMHTMPPDFVAHALPIFEAVAARFDA